MLCWLTSINAPNFYIPFLSQSPKHSFKDSELFSQYNIIIEQFDFERKISGFEQISSKIRDIEKILLLKNRLLK